MGSGYGLRRPEELVLLECLVAGDRDVAVAAAQFDLRRHLVDLGVLAVLELDRARRHVDILLDAQPVAAPPVLDLEARVAGEKRGQVEAGSRPDRLEADVEQPVAGDAPPQPAPHFDPEAYLEACSVPRIVSALFLSSRSMMSASQNTCV